MSSKLPTRSHGWIGAATFELSAADLEGSAIAITQTGAGAGPLRPVPVRHGVAI